jgi:hypothetical protein
LRRRRGAAEALVSFVAEERKPPMTVLALLERVLVPTLEICLLVGSLSSTLLGCALVFRTARAIDFTHRMNRWVSTRRALKEAELPRHGGTPGASRKPWFGLFLLVGGAFVLYFLAFRTEIPHAAAVLGVDLKRWFLAGIALQTARWFLVAGSLLAVCVGVLLLAFPKTLTAFEERMNRWYSTRRILPPEGESMRYPLDMLVEAYPHAAGWTIAAASLLVAAAMGLLLAARITG